MRRFWKDERGDGDLTPVLWIFLVAVIIFTCATVFDWDHYTEKVDNLSKSITITKMPFNPLEWLVWSGGILYNLFNVAWMFFTMDISILSGYLLPLRVILVLDIWVTIIWALRRLILG